jgi:hypothetical protein
MRNSVKAGHIYKFASLIDSHVISMGKLVVALNRVMTVHKSKTVAGTYTVVNMLIFASYKFSPGSERSGRDGLLLLNVLAQDVDRGTAARGSKVARRPKHAAAAQPRMEVSKLLAHQPTRDTFEAVHQRGKRNLWRVIDQEMDMILFAVELHQGRIEACADGSEDAFKALHVFLAKHPAPVLCHEDQMNMKRKNAVPTVSNVLYGAHRPSIIDIG